MKPFGDTGVLVTVKMTQYLSVLELQGNILVVGVDCKSGICEERLGIPGVRHSQFQLAQMDPSQGIAVTPSQDGAILRKVYLRNSK